MNTFSVGLTSDELYEVTHYRYPQKQIHALLIMGIPFKVRPDGSVFVARSAIEGEPTTPQPLKHQDWVINM